MRVAFARRLQTLYQVGKRQILLRHSAHGCAAYAAQQLRHALLRRMGDAHGNRIDEVAHHLVELLAGAARHGRADHDIVLARQGTQQQAVSCQHCGKQGRGIPARQRMQFGGELRRQRKADTIAAPAAAARTGDIATQLQHRQLPAQVLLPVLALRFGGRAVQPGTLLRDIGGVIGLRRQGRQGLALHQLAQFIQQLPVRPAIASDMLEDQQQHAVLRALGVPVRTHQRRCRQVESDAAIGLHLPRQIGIVAAADITVEQLHRRGAGAGDALLRRAGRLPETAAQHRMARGQRLQRRSQQFQVQRTMHARCEAIIVRALGGRIQLVQEPAAALRGGQGEPQWGQAGRAHTAPAVCAARACRCCASWHTEG